MASLKSYFNSLLTSWRESHKSVPESSFTAYEFPNCYGHENVANQKFIMPYDGVFCAQANATIVCIRKGSTVDVFNSGESNSTRGWPCGSVNCKKGDEIHFYLATLDNNSTTMYYRVYKNVGAT